MAEGSKFPLTTDPMPSATDPGVQMPGPMSGGGDDGFNATGQDYSMMPNASVDSGPIGVQLPGDPTNEQGWNFGADMSNLAPVEPNYNTAPGVSMGVFSDDASFNLDVSTLSRPSMTTTDLGGNGFMPGGGQPDAGVVSIPGSGNQTAGGMDSDD